MKLKQEDRLKIKKSLKKIVPSKPEDAVLVGVLAAAGNYAPGEVESRVISEIDGVAIYEVDGELVEVSNPYGNVQIKKLT